MDELLTVAEMTQADRLTAERGISFLQLMENAGQAVADAVTARCDRSRPVVVFAGPGNNGGDGCVAARLLSERGLGVELRFLGDVMAMRGEAATVAARYGGKVGRLGEPIPTGAVVVDALFGAGLARDIEGQAAETIAAINGSDAEVVAVDLPSGINGDDGQPCGTAVQATETITFFRKKPGHVLLPGRSYCGRVRVADIGIRGDVLEEIKPKLALNRPSRWGDLFAVPQAVGHKYSRGHALIVSGGPSSTGAARLAARGALRAGAGLVTIAGPSGAMPILAATNLAVMVREADDADGLAELLRDKRISAVVLGPGGGVGAEMIAKVRVALRQHGSIILDADALTSFSGRLTELFTARPNPAESSLILTPHEGEFSRLFSSMQENSEVKQKLKANQFASHETDSVILLKGGDSVISAPDGRSLISDNAPPFLATAGAGDVLAGMIAGLCAQGMPAFEATAAAVWLHGEAAWEVGPGLISEDLPEALMPVYRRLFTALGVTTSTRDGVI